MGQAPSRSPAAHCPSCRRNRCSASHMWSPPAHTCADSSSSSRQTVRGAAATVKSRHCGQETPRLAPFSSPPREHSKQAQHIRGPARGRHQHTRSNCVARRTGSRMRPFPWYMCILRLPPSLACASAIHCPTSDTAHTCRCHAAVAAVSHRASLPGVGLKQQAGNAAAASLRHCPLTTSVARLLIRPPAVRYDPSLCLPSGGNGGAGLARMRPSTSIVCSAGRGSREAASMGRHACMVGKIQKMVSCTQAHGGREGVPRGCCTAAAVRAPSWQQLTLPSPISSAQKPPHCCGGTSRLARPSTVLHQYHVPLGVCSRSQNRRLQQGSGGTGQQAGGQGFACVATTEKLLPAHRKSPSPRSRSSMNCRLCSW